MKEIKYISHSIIETEQFATQLAKKSKPNDIICLNGELGVGKTVIAKSIGKFFNVKENITSPTFSILKTYNTNNKLIKKIHHFDLYRIKNIIELENIGFTDFIYEKNTLSIIEWPEIARDLLPDKVININIIQADNNIRNIIYEG